MRNDDRNSGNNNAMEVWAQSAALSHTPFKHTKSPNTLISEIPKNVNKTECRGAGDSDYSGNLLRNPTHGIV